MTEQSNFPIAIKAITDMADYYDSKNKPKLAEKLTTVARNLVNIKTAQFVGGQGYWVRNTRCWDNCYRQKRATDTTKTAQEVWTACHEEYLKSINDSESGWEKYAENIGTFKFAGKNMQNTIKTAAQTFHKEMTKRVKAGVEVGVAVHATIQDNIEKYNNSFIDELQELTKIATYLKEHKQKKEAATLTGVANELIKEAQWYRPDKWLGSWGGDNVDEIKGMIGHIDEYYQNAIMDVQQGQPIQGVIDNLYNLASSKMKEIQQKASQMKLKKQDAIKILKKIQTVLAATNSNPSMQTLQTARRNISNIVLDVENMDPMNVQERNPYVPSGTPPQGGGPPPVPTSQSPPASVPMATAANRKGALQPLAAYLTDIKQDRGDAETIKEIEAIIKLLEDAKGKMGQQSISTAPVPAPAPAPTKKTKKPRAKKSPAPVPAPAPAPVPTPSPAPTQQRRPPAARKPMDMV